MLLLSPGQGKHLRNSLPVLFCFSFLGNSGGWRNVQQLVLWAVSQGGGCSLRHCCRQHLPCQLCQLCLHFFQKIPHIWSDLGYISLSPCLGLALSFLTSRRARCSLPAPHTCEHVGLEELPWVSTPRAGNLHSQSC